MTTQWNDENLSNALKKMGQTTSQQPAFDQTWFKIEERIATRRNHFVWKPWGHPVRWVMATACLCVASTGVVYHQNVVDQNETASYILSVANPTANVTKELGVEKVSVLLSESSPTVAEINVDDHLDSLDADEILL